MDCLTGFGEGTESTWKCMWQEYIASDEVLKILRYIPNKYYVFYLD